MSDDALREFGRFMEQQRDELAAMDLTEYGRGRYDQVIVLIDRLPVQCRCVRNGSGWDPTNCPYHNPVATTTQDSRDAGN